MKKHFKCILLVGVLSLSSALCACSSMNDNPQTAQGTTITQSTEGTTEIQTDVNSNTNISSKYSEINPANIDEVVDFSKIAKLSTLNNGDEVFSDNKTLIADFEDISRALKIGEGRDKPQKYGGTVVSAYDSDGKLIYQLSPPSNKFFIEDTFFYCSLDYENLSKLYNLSLDIATAKDSQDE